MTDDDLFAEAMNPDYRPPSFAEAIANAYQERLTHADLIAARDALLQPTPWPLLADPIPFRRLTADEVAAYRDAPPIPEDTDDEP